MKKFWLIAGICLVTLSGSRHACAFSTNADTHQNSDGSSKFIDPDEQLPGFMVAPGSEGNGSGGLPLRGSSVNSPTMEENDNGAHAFNQIFTQQQNK